MTTSFDAILSRVAQIFSKCNFDMTLGFPRQWRKPLKKPTGILTLAGCESFPAGFQDYLGEYFNEEFQTWDSLYGRRMKATVSVDLFVPLDLGEELVRTLFGEMQAALMRCAPHDFKVRECSLGGISYDNSAAAFRASVKISCELILYAFWRDEEEEFSDFVLRGDLIP